MGAPLRPDVSKATAAAALRRLWPEPTSNLAALKDGEISAAFAFVSGGRNYILRLNRRPGQFAIDREAHHRFGSAGIPIPRILVIGEFSDLAVCISEKAPGELLSDLPPLQQQALVPAVLAMLERIHAVDISRYPGYGPWKADGKAEYESAQALVQAELHVLTEAASRLRDKPMREAVAGARALLPCLSGERHLLHGDYGFNNMTVRGGAVTGVFDWANSNYGDRVKDLAWLDFWQDRIDYTGAYAQRLQREGKVLPNLVQRKQFWMLLEVAGCLNFYHDKGDLRGRSYVLNRFAQIKGGGLRLVS